MHLNVQHIPRGSTKRTGGTIEGDSKVKDSRETTSSTERIGGTIEGAEKVKDLKLVAILVGFFLPSNSVKFIKTYGNLEFISPGSRATLSSARAWFKQYGSVLAEITNEEFMNLTVRFVDGFELYDTDKHLIVNAKGKELSAWLWISGDTFTYAELRIHIYQGPRTNKEQHMPTSP